jgi:signal transduction histidine kinase
MVKILGEHLIRDNTVGLMELVKNAYDADATEVFIKFEHIREPERTWIIVQDNGVGMTEEIIRGAWFEPAHGGKEEQKRTQRRTSLGRLPLGEKGVGRFAAQRLGRKLQLVTRPSGGEKEYALDINWDDFGNLEGYLDEVRIPIKTRKPEVLTGTDHGTRLIMIDTRYPWRKTDLDRFHASLMRLLSPRRKVENFRVTLRCPEFPDIERVDETEFLARFQFRIDCLVDEKGTGDYEFRYRDEQGNEDFQTDVVDLWSIAQPDECTERSPACGPFFVQISAWMLKSEILAKYGLTRDKLKVLAGVSIYRDGFRVLPYGDEGDDWLGLDARRINVPASRFGNRQVIGFVEIDQVQTPDLMDKTNREGLQENQAYRDFKDLVLAVVTQLEQRSLERRRQLTAPKTGRQELETTIEDLKQEIQRIKSDAEERTAETPELEGTIPDGCVVIPKDQLAELEERATYVSESVKDILEAREDERETFLHLLGIGLAAERFAHEFDLLVDRSSRLIQKLKQVGELSPDERQQLDNFVNTLRNEIRLMGTLRYVRRSQRSTEVSVRKVIELVLLARDQDIKRHSIRTELRLNGDVTAYMPEASVAQVVDNIIDNAIYWLKQKAEKDDRRLRLELDSDRQSLLISNNGAVVQPNIKKNLFVMPFITSKPEGRGLGMYIVSEILKQYGGCIRLVSPDQETRVLGGAAFRVDIGKRITTQSAAADAGS